MTPEQLIDLLEQAGMLKEESPGVFGWNPNMKKAERFAEFIAAAEREACARLLEDYERFGDTRDCIAAIRGMGV